MFADFYANNPLLFWPLVGLVIFVASFAAVLLYVAFGLRDRRKVDYIAALPLAADTGAPLEIHDDKAAGRRAEDD